jgi:hypothetical protein
MNTAVSQVPLSRPWQRLLSAHLETWRGAGAALWAALQAAGNRRAERELFALLEQWDVTHPELAKELRASLRRGD